MSASTAFDELVGVMTLSFDSTRSKMFGCPCIKQGKRAYTIFKDDRVAFRIGLDRVNQLKATFPDTCNFDPSGKGKPMKDWFEAGPEHAAQWRDWATEAMFYLEEK